MTWKTFIRPVLVLLVIGVIIGLGSIYINIDSSDVSAESNGGIEENIEGESQDKPETPPVEELPEADTPDVEENGEGVAPTEDIGMSGELKTVLDVDRGYIIVTGDAHSTHMRYLEQGEVQHETSLAYPYVTAGVGRYGIALVVRDGENAEVYTYDKTLREHSRQTIKGAIGQALILEQDDLSILYEREGGLSSVIYGDHGSENSILDIDNVSAIKAMYNTGYGDAYVIYENGLVVNTLPTIWRTRLTLGYEVEDIRPIMYEERIGYAVLDKNAIDRHIRIYTSDFRLRHCEATIGSLIVYTDTLYTLDSMRGMLDTFCGCGRLDEREETDIDTVTYVDYIERKIYYRTTDGASYVSPFGDMRHRSPLDAVVLYDNAEFRIYLDDVMRLRFK